MGQAELTQLEDKKNGIANQDSVAARAIQAEIEALQAQPDFPMGQARSSQLEDKMKNAIAEQDAVAADIEALQAQPPLRG